MKKTIKKLIALTMISTTLLGVSSVGANAEWRESGNNWWYSQGSSYATGWTQINGQWYYFNSNGYMKTGWQYDNGNWFYLYGEGIMAHDCWIGNYYVNSNGAWTNAVTMSNYDYNNKIDDICIRFSTWCVKCRDVENKIDGDDLYLTTDTFKHSIADLATEIHEIYEEASTLNPNDRYKSVNNSFVSYIKCFDEAMALCNQGIIEHDITKIKKSDEVFKKSNDEYVKMIGAVKDLRNNYSVK